MTIYEAEHEKKYVTAPGDGTLRTFKQKAAYVIDTNWKYSWHWGENWVEDAKRDCLSRIEDARKELTTLEALQEVLKRIEE